MRVIITAELIANYMGGQLETHSSGDVYRGEIAKIELVGDPAELVNIDVTLTWNAKLTGAHWVREEQLEYKPELCSVSNIGPSNPGESDRLVLQSYETGEIFTLFPADGTKLLEANIKESTSL